MHDNLWVIPDLLQMLFFFRPILLVEGPRNRQIDGNFLFHAPIISSLVLDVKPFLENVIFGKQGVPIAKIPFFYTL